MLSGVLMTFVVAWMNALRRVVLLCLNLCLDGFVGDDSCAYYKFLFPMVLVLEVFCFRVFIRFSLGGVAGASFWYIDGRLLYILMRVVCGVDLARLS